MHHTTIGRFVALAAVLAPAAGALAVAPEIFVVDSTRSISLGLTAESIQNGSVFSNSLFDGRDGPVYGPWEDDLFRTLEPADGASSQGLAYMKSNVSTFVLDGEGAVECWANGGPDGTVATGGASTNFNYKIMLPDDAAFSVTAEAIFDADAMAGSSVSVNIYIFGTEPDGSFLFETAGFNSSAPTITSPYQLFTAAECKGGTELTIAVTAGGSAEGDSHCRMDFKFEANFGDTDKDGLLDIWETDGIDINDDGTPEVYLNDADPMRKDIYVELDAMTGVPVDMTAIEDVVNAFALAPAGLIENPDGSTGINLHVEISDTNLPFSVVNDMSTVDLLKPNWWGDEIDRVDPNKVAIQAARDKVYHYCLWAGTMNDGSSGLGERPGNDFIVAATTAATMTNLPTEALSGTFMHELGHNLGLRHGGQDGLNHKPNYVSVMNYSYQVPWIGSEPAFFLDYSNSVMNPLDEDDLVEPLGLDGPGYKNVMFNSAPHGLAPVRTIVPADSPMVDFDLDGNKTNGDADRDLNRFRASDPASPAQFLVSYNDWNSLWYGLSGNVNYNDGAPRLSDAFEAELTGAEITELQSTQVVDLTAPPCVADINTKNVNPGDPAYGTPDGTVDGADLSYFVENWLGFNAAVADVNTKNVNPGDPAYGTPDGLVDGADLSYFVEKWLAGCP